jgi:hypothetical protein
MSKTTKKGVKQIKKQPQAALPQAPSPLPPPSKTKKSDKVRKFSS